MPRNRPLDSYPNAHFAAVFRRALGDADPFLIPCTAPQAASLRGEMYAWRRACEREPQAAFEQGCPTGQELRAVALRIVPEGLQALRAETLPGPTLIAAALGGTPEAALPATAALDRLRGLLKEGDDGGE